MAEEKLESKKAYARLTHAEKILQAQQEIERQQKKLKMLTDKRKLEIGSIAEKFGLLDLKNQVFEEAFAKLKKHD